MRWTPKSGQRQGGFDFREGDHRVQAGMMFHGEAAFRPPPPDGRHRHVRFDVDEHLERLDGEVGVAFFTQVDAARGLAEHSEKTDRAALPSCR